MAVPALSMRDQRCVRTTNTSACPLMETCRGGRRCQACWSAESKNAAGGSQQDSTHNCWQRPRAHNLCGCACATQGRKHAAHRVGRAPARHCKCLTARVIMLHVCLHALLVQLCMHKSDAAQRACQGRHTHLQVHERAHNGVAHVQLLPHALGERIHLATLRMQGVLRHLAQRGRWVQLSLCQNAVAASDQVICVTASY